jgi:hypothetical protein
VSTKCPLPIFCIDLKVAENKIKSDLLLYNKINIELPKKNSPLHKDKIVKFTFTQVIFATSPRNEPNVEINIILCNAPNHR